MDDLTGPAVPAGRGHRAAVDEILAALEVGTLTSEQDLKLRSLLYLLDAVGRDEPAGYTPGRDPVQDSSRSGALQILLLQYRELLDTTRRVVVDPGPGESDG